MTQQPHPTDLSARPPEGARDSQEWLTELVLRMRFVTAVLVVIASVAAGVMAGWSPSPWVALMAVGWMADAARRVRAGEDETTETPHPNSPVEDCDIDLDPSVLRKPPSVAEIKDAEFKRIYDNLQAFRADYKLWNEWAFLPRPGTKRIAK